MSEEWRTQLASDIVRDGLGVELIDVDDRVIAEVFRCDTDHSVTVAVFEHLPLIVMEQFLETARRQLGEFEDGSPLPHRHGP
jgi:hypothetical protein